jgi:hypothetical protein
MILGWKFADLNINCLELYAITPPLIFPLSPVNYRSDVIFSLEEKSENGDRKTQGNWKPLCCFN